MLFIDYVASIEVNCRCLCQQILLACSPHTVLVRNVHNNGRTVHKERNCSVTERFAVILGLIESKLKFCSSTTGKDKKKPVIAKRLIVDSKIYLDHVTTFTFETRGGSAQLCTKCYSILQLLILKNYLCKKDHLIKGSRFK